MDSINSGIFVDICTQYSGMNNIFIQRNRRKSDAWINEYSFNSYFDYLV